MASLDDSGPLVQSPPRSRRGSKAANQLLQNVVGAHANHMSGESMSLSSFPVDTSLFIDQLINSSTSVGTLQKRAGLRRSDHVGGSVDQDGLRRFSSPTSKQEFYTSRREQLAHKSYVDTIMISQENDRRKEIEAEGEERQQDLAFLRQIENVFGDLTSAVDNVPRGAEKGPVNDPEGGFRETAIDATAGKVPQASPVREKGNHAPVPRFHNGSGHRGGDDSAGSRPRRPGPEMGRIALVESQYEDKVEDLLKRYKLETAQTYASLETEKFNNGQLQGRVQSLVQENNELLLQHQAIMKDRDEKVKEIDSLQLGLEKLKTEYQNNVALLLETHVLEINQCRKETEDVTASLQSEFDHEKNMSRIKFENVLREQREESFVQVSELQNQLTLRDQKIAHLEQTLHNKNAAEEQLTEKCSKLKGEITKLNMNIETLTIEAESSLSRLNKTDKQFALERQQIHEQTSRQIHAVEKRLLQRISELEIELSAAVNNVAQANHYNRLLKERYKAMERSFRNHERDSIDIGNAVFGLVNEFDELTTGTTGLTEHSLEEKAMQKLQDRREMQRLEGERIALEKTKEEIRTFENSRIEQEKIALERARAEMKISKQKNTKEVTKDEDLIHRLATEQDQHSIEQTQGMIQTMKKKKLHDQVGHLKRDMEDMRRKLAEQKRHH